MFKFLRPVCSRALPRVVAAARTSVGKWRTTKWTALVLGSQQGHGRDCCILLALYVPFSCKVKPHEHSRKAPFRRCRIVGWMEDGAQTIARCSNVFCAAKPGGSAPALPSSRCVPLSLSLSLSLRLYLASGVALQTDRWVSLLSAQAHAPHSKGTMSAGLPQVC